MSYDLSVWMGDIHHVVSPVAASVIVTIVSVLCGAAIGSERQRREKPAGMRTMMLICLGACIFTQTGLYMAGGNSDPMRVASQVVTGVGFLGAGAILHGRGMIVGFTSAAAIWAIAAIGIAVGAGHVAAGVFFTFVAVATLAAERTLERAMNGPCAWSTLRVEFDPDGGKTRPLIQEILDQTEIDDKMVSFEEGATGAASSSVRIRYCWRHRPHRSFASQIAAIATVRSMVDAREG